MLKVSEKNYEKDFETSTRLVGKERNSCHYLKALFNTLVEFKPRVCIEIGTNTGNTTKVFQRYFDQHMPSGLLVTCDIKKYVDLSPLKNVKQLIVAHHIPHIEKFHKVKKEELSFFPENSVSVNTQLLKDVAQEYDFAFIDGDHTKDSFFKDIEICENVLKDPKLMLLDDTKEPFHECSQAYFDIVKKDEKYETYDFEDWKKFVGCSLIRKKL
jgi:predicted O-methyltransferase YrrM